MVEVGEDLWMSPGPTPLFRQGCLELVASTLYMPPFCIWVWPGAPCSFMQASCHFCLTLYLLEWNSVELGEGNPWIWTSFLGPSFPPGPYLKQLFWAEDAKVFCPGVQDCELAFHLPSCPQDPEVQHLIVTAAQAAFDFHIPNKPLTVDAYEVQQNISPHWLL